MKFITNTNLFFSLWSTTAINNTFVRSKFNTQLIKNNKHVDNYIKR